MHRLPHYQIVQTKGSYFVVRKHDGVTQVIERFENESDAEEFFSFLNWVAEAPKRVASH